MKNKTQYSDEIKDRNTLKFLYLLNNSYRKVADDFEVIRGVKLHPSMIRMLINGYNPGKKIRKVLSWQPLSPAPVCLKCGKVHVTKYCTAQRRHYRDLFAMPAAALRKALEEREVF